MGVMSRTYREVWFPHEGRDTLTVRTRGRGTGWRGIYGWKGPGRGVMRRREFEYEKRANGPVREDGFDYSWPGHVYDGERCMYCNVNCYDDWCYGPFECVEHGELVWRTESRSGK